MPNNHKSSNRLIRFKNQTFNCPMSNKIKFISDKFGIPQEDLSEYHNTICFRMRGGSEVSDEELFIDFRKVSFENIVNRNNRKFVYDKDITPKFVQNFINSHDKYARGPQEVNIKYRLGKYLNLYVHKIKVDDIPKLESSSPIYVNFRYLAMHVAQEYLIEWEGKEKKEQTINSRNKIIKMKKLLIMLCKFFQKEWNEKSKELARLSLIFLDMMANDLSQFLSGPITLSEQFFVENPEMLSFNPETYDISNGR